MFSHAPLSMPTIRTSDGAEIRVSHADHAYLSEHSWSRFRSSGQAYRRERIAEDLRTPRGPKHRTLMLHRVVAGATARQKVVFLDADPTNCTRENLEVISPKELAWRKPPAPRGRSKYRGVSWNRVKEQWQVAVRVDGHLKHLGFWPAGEEGERAAAEAYDLFVRKVRGEKARLNFPLRPRRRPKAEAQQRPAKTAPAPTIAPSIADLYQKRPEDLTPEEIRRLRERFFTGSAG